MCEDKSGGRKKIKSKTTLNVFPKKITCLPDFDRWLLFYTVDKNVLQQPTHPHKFRNRGDLICEMEKVESKWWKSFCCLRPFKRFRITLWFLLVIAPHILMWANKKRENRNIIRACRHTDKVWTQSEEYYGRKIIITQCMMKQYDVKRDGEKKIFAWKERWRDFFIFTVRVYLCIWRLLIFEAPSEAARQYFKVCCSYVFSVCCLLGISFLFFFTTITFKSRTTSSCLTHLFIFSRNWIIYLRDFERENKKGKKVDGSKNHQLLPKTFTPSLNLNTVKALSLSPSSSQPLIETLDTSISNFTKHTKKTISCEIEINVSELKWMLRKESALTSCGIMRF